MLDSLPLLLRGAGLDDVSVTVAGMNSKLARFALNTGAGFPAVDAGRALVYRRVTGTN